MIHDKSLVLRALSSVKLMHDKNTLHALDKEGPMSVCAVHSYLHYVDATPMEVAAITKSDKRARKWLETIRNQARQSAPGGDIKGAEAKVRE